MEEVGRWCASGAMPPQHDSAVRVRELMAGSKVVTAIRREWELAIPGGTTQAEPSSSASVSTPSNLDSAVESPLDSRRAKINSSTSARPTPHYSHKSTSAQLLQ